MASAVVDPGTERAADGPGQGRPPRRPRAGRAFAREAARESGFAAALEAGDLPAELVEHADEAGRRGAARARRPRHRLRVRRLGAAVPCTRWRCSTSSPGRSTRDPYVLLLLRGRTREDLLAEVARWPRGGRAPGARGARGGPGPGGPGAGPGRGGAAGHGLADAAVAAYDEAVSRLL